MTERLPSWLLGRAPLLATTLAAASACLALRAAPARACGGFFCSQAAPVSQASEEIIFADNADGTVTAVISIQYTGPSEKFAWVLPIPGAPDEVAVSSNIAFTNLRQLSDPQYFLNTTVEGECRNSGFGNVGAPGTGAQAPTSPEPSFDNDGVGVVAQGAVGPYDWHVISVDPQLPDPADTAVTWLVDNGYDVTEIGPDVLRPYLESGLNLMAFKLTKGADANTGSIRPVVITYESEVPAIPIRPTAVAAQNDMGILVWVLGETQAIPQNYKSLVINEALINWFNFRQNYRQVVTAAADEAGGQGFVTEMAGDSGQLDARIFGPGDEQTWRDFSLTQFQDGFQMMQEASWRYRGWDGWRDAICGAVTLPADLTCDEFGRSPDAYRGSVQIDEQAFMLALYEDVVRPVIKTQELLLSRPYFTRLFSTMSADEMTMDPAFDFNADLADLSNVHMAEQVIECDSSVTTFEAPWCIELPQGGVIRGKGQQGLWPIAMDDLPANLKIVQLGTSGSGQVVQNNRDDILDALFELSGTTGEPAGPGGRPDGGVVIGGNDDPGGALPQPGDEEPEPGAEEGPGERSGDNVNANAASGDGSDGGLCSVGRVRGGGNASGWWVLMVAAVLGLRARRRR